MALVCAVSLMASCSKGEEEEEIQIYGMDKVSLTTTLSYTRTGNKVTFSPAFNDKYESAKLIRAYGTGKESISWDCGNGQIYNFSRP